jgi:hypothetical protein
MTVRPAANMMMLLKDSEEHKCIPEIHINHRVIEDTAKDPRRAMNGEAERADAADAAASCGARSAPSALKKLRILIIRTIRVCAGS